MSLFQKLAYRSCLGKLRFNFRFSAFSTAVQSKRPTDSWIVKTLPFSCDPNLREKYTSVFGHVRVGKLLEVLDLHAGRIAYSHTSSFPPGDPNCPVYLVTAAVDQIQLLSTPSLYRDLIVQGCVTYTGRSSMEIRIEVAHIGKYSSDQPGPENNQPDQYDPPTPVLKSYFTFVARDVHTHKAHEIPSVVPVSALEKQWYKEAVDRRARKQSDNQADLASAPPTTAEQRQLHQLLLQSKHTFVSHCQPVSQTRLENTHVMHPQKRNIHGKIFGGYLIRESFELAWATALLYAKVQPILINIDEITFIAPVPIGSIVHFQAIAVFSSTNSVQVFVNADVIDKNSGSRTTTNVFKFAFFCQKHQGKSLIPSSYGEAMNYLQAQRTYQRNKTLVTFTVTQGIHCVVSHNAHVAGSSLLGPLGLLD